MKLLYNGKVYVNGNYRQAVLIDGKKILYVGSDKEALKKADSSTKLIDLAGRLVLPGFVESHAHPALFGSLVIDRIDLTVSEDAEEYKAIIKQFIDDNPALDFYVGAGWYSTAYDEQGPRKEILDDICSDKPIVLMSREGHSVWANSKAIEMAGITDDTQSPPGGVIEKYRDGRVLGTFKDAAQTPVKAIIPDAGVESIKKAIRQYQQEMVQLGYTASTEMMMKKNDKVHQAYKEMAKDEELIIKAGITYRIDPEDTEDYMKSLENPARTMINKLAEGFFVKIFIDGVVEGSTAWLKESYSNNPGFSGEGIWKDEELFDYCERMDRQGYDFHIHAIGDAANAQVVRMVEHLNKVNGLRKDRKVVIAHMQLADESDIRKMSDLGIMVSSNPYWFFKEPSYFYNVEKPCLGERGEKEYPMQMLFDYGIIVSVGSDYNITPNPDPLEAIRIACERVIDSNDKNDMDVVLNPAQRTSVSEMVEAVTTSGAKTLSIEGYTGTLEAGKLADMVVLNTDILEMDTSDYIENAFVDITISEGKIVYER